MVNDAPGQVKYVTPNETFWKWHEASHKPNSQGTQRDLRQAPILALDPGETTGVAIWDPTSRRIVLEQWDTREIGPSYDKISDTLEALKMGPCTYPGVAIDPEVVFEDYRIYGFKTQDHAFSGVHTIQLIGAIRVCLYKLGIQHTSRMAADAKTFATDDNLIRWGLYVPGMRHARDALRHLAFHLIWPNKQSTVK